MQLANPRSSWQSFLARRRRIPANSDALTVLSKRAILLDLTERLVVTALYGRFAYKVLLNFADSPGLITALLFISETAPFLFILLRAPSTTLSDRPSDWLFGMAGTTAPLLIETALENPIVAPSLCLAIIISGLFLQISGKLVLGFSFGVIAANRGVKVSGPYRFVRHPIYAGYTVTHVGLLLAMPSALNATLYTVALALQIVRIQREERILDLDQKYRDFSARVRYRLLPGVF
ncbi:MAG: isoprenylcysteine carboxylmethyltransferase family protein [Bradyrhizobiaceae bacterium]|nr:MAG: isoprenylcysteine carboxylmethyltransferase family protein [Bradyrhizobiaceae bacterium]